MKMHLGSVRGSGLPDIVVFLVWVSGLAFTLIAILSAAMTAWRLGADPGWTQPFFITDGLFSRYPAWIVISICAQTAAFFIKRWASRQNASVRVLATSGRRSLSIAPSEAVTAAV